MIANDDQVEDYGKLASRFSDSSSDSVSWLLDHGTNEKRRVSWSDEAGRYICVPSDVVSE